MIITNIEHLRDPFVLVTDDAYYVYGTGVDADWDNTTWVCYKNTSNSLDGEWIETEKLVYVRPENAEKNSGRPRFTNITSTIICSPHIFLLQRNTEDALY